MRSFCELEIKITLKMLDKKWLKNFMTHRILLISNKLWNMAISEILMKLFRCKNNFAVSRIFSEVLIAQIDINKNWRIINFDCQSQCSRLRNRVFEKIVFTAKLTRESMATAWELILKYGNFENLTLFHKYCHFKWFLPNKRYLKLL